MNRKLKTLALPVGAAVILGTSGFAYMASNTVSPSSAGEGTSTISGFDVSNISYQTSAGDLTYVNFDADPVLPHDATTDPANAEITFDGTNWTSCTRTSLSRALDPEAHFVCDVRGKSIPATANNMTAVVTH